MRKERAPQHLPDQSAYSFMPSIKSMLMLLEVSILTA
jgi:hypothetical protein